MGKLRRAPLDEVGDLDAPPGSRPWSIAVWSKMRSALKDERMSARHLEQWRNRFVEFHGYQNLTDEAGEPFPTFAAFCHAPEPFGLGYDPAAIDAIITERRSAEARAQAPKKLAEHRRPTADEESDKGVVNTFIERGSTNADYLTARIARDRPDILDRMKAGEYRSVRAAALDAGIVRRRVSIPADDCERAARALLRHFDAGELVAWLRRLSEG